MRRSDRTIEAAVIPPVKAVVADIENHRRIGCCQAADLTEHLAILFVRFHEIVAEDGQIAIENLGFTIEALGGGDLGAAGNLSMQLRQASAASDLRLTYSLGITSTLTIYDIIIK